MSCIATRMELLEIRVIPPINVRACREHNKRQKRDSAHSMDAVVNKQPELAYEHNVVCCSFMLLLVRYALSLINIGLFLLFVVFPF